VLILLLLTVFFTSSLFGFSHLFFKEQRFPAFLVYGTAIVLLLLHIFHFFFPITWSFSLILLLIGNIFTFKFVREHWGRKKILNLFSLTKKWGRDHPISLFLDFLVLAFGVTFILFVAYTGVFYIDYYDSYLYHIPVVNWINRQAAIQGFVLLHSRFGFTNGIFLLSALFNSLARIPITQHSFYATPNVIFAIWLILLSIHGIIRIIHSLSLRAHSLNSFMSYAIQALSFPIFLVFFERSYVSSLAQETGLYVFFILSASLAFFSPPISLLAASIGVVLKMSGLFWTLFVSGLIFFQFRKIGDHRRTILLTFLLIFFWTMRTLFFTGQLLFPISFTTLPFWEKFALSFESKMAVQASIREWARYNPYQQRIDSEIQWFFNFFRHTVPFSFWYSLVLFVGNTIAFLFLMIKKRDFLLKHGLGLLFFLMTASGISLGLSYYSAPDIRLLWPLFALSMVLILVFFVSILYLSFKKRTLFLALSFLLFLVCLYIFPKEKLQKFIENPHLDRRLRLVIPTPSLKNQFAKYTTYPSIPFSFTLSEGDQCGTADLPCLINATEAATLKFNVSESGAIKSIERMEN